MRKAAVSLLTILALLPVIYLFAETEQNLNPFEPFTGKIARNKVRLRLQPNLDGIIVRELNRGELLLVVGEAEEFYLVKPPQDIKAYIFRTFILDNTVEGKHVNVRLAPEVESPVITQLNSGDPIEGKISPLNSKWLEIDPPEGAKFYVCKEFMENIGGPSKLAEICKRTQELQSLLDNTEEISQSELQKPYAEIHIEKAIENLNTIIAHYTDFPEQTGKAKELLSFIQDSYMQKKIAFLEAKTQTAWTDVASVQKLPVIHIPEPDPKSEPMDGKLAAWIPIEKKYFAEWAKDRENPSMHDFYSYQKNEAVILTGTVEPYIRHIRNKPGDFILIARHSRMPNAYLYSTKVDLSAKVGQEVTLIALPRPNNNFAHPAYFVLSVE